MAVSCTDDGVFYLPELVKQVETHRAMSARGKKGGNPQLKLT